MVPAERIYRALLWLYPPGHRRAYGRLMVQHARDLGRAARQDGRRREVVVSLRLVADLIVNALVEHREAIMMGRGLYEPVPWLSVLVAAVPGLWVALSRRHADVLGPLLLVLGGGYLLLLAIGLPVMWWRERRFPVWGLIFVGALAWYAVYRGGMGLSQRLGLGPVLGWQLGVVLLNVGLATVLFVLLLRGRRLPGKVWLIVGCMGVVNILGAIVYGLVQLGDSYQMRELLQYVMASLAFLAEGLMFVAVGLLAARQHGVLALLVVIGGYGYLFMDTDNLIGYSMRNWAGLTVYLVTVCLLYLVLVPVALLRARTRAGRAVAIFGPVALFLLLRLVVPMLATQGLARVSPGEAGLAINVLLVLALGWFLYDDLSDVQLEGREMAW